ncbi:DUF924 family protein [Actibacterium pelagium]|uniref:DUF924 domain-containing protein n=1 Tax=Actibacterium pelagium TaxID=2029103 RepID=A0A917EJW1_9RHOB|nr:DUF924 family protein [Actibacterium pelagium]GGE45208.1 hypothetical protein GCM10011517_11010 [Actibacterium pelagium]
MDPQEVIDFWVKDVGPKGWYEQSDELDQTIRDRFMDVWECARDGKLHGWLASAEGILAYLIVTDQFPRNMFRNDPRAFSTDRLARAAAKQAVDQDFDMRVAEPERQFFYLPMMHSECLTDQDRCVRLMMLGMSADSSVLHARAHREIIRKFGRFPYRNEALSRNSSEEELAFINQGGYGAIVRELQAAA